MEKRCSKKNKKNLSRHTFQMILRQQKKKIGRSPIVYISIWQKSLFKSLTSVKKLDSSMESTWNNLVTEKEVAHMMGPSWIFKRGACNLFRTVFWEYCSMYQLLQYFIKKYVYYSNMLTYSFRNVIKIYICKGVSTSPKYKRWVG